MADCYIRQDFLELCQGDALKAEIVFSLSNWQHPPTILAEWDPDDEERLRDLKEERRVAESETRHTACNVPKAMNMTLAEIKAYCISSFLRYILSPYLQGFCLF